MSNQNHIGTNRHGGLLKEAALALDIAQKRNDAVKLAFDMIERGKITPFQTHGDFMDKVAELMSKDLRVVEEALEMDSSMADFGKVASEGGSPTNAHDAFFHRLADND